MKTIEEIYAGMCADFTARCGMEVVSGGDLSARLYAAAAQIYGLYAQAEWVKNQCFPQTAQGDCLDLHAQVRALERKQATRAQGTVRFFAEPDAQTNRVIPAGTVCMTAGLVRFETEEDGVLPAGADHADLSVQAVEAGQAGNVAPGSIRTLSAPPAGITDCTNPGGTTGGADEESDDSLRARILDSFARMPNGANAAYYERQAMSIDGVADAAALPRSRGRGTVDVVIAGTGGVPEQEVLDRVEQRLQESREIAVDVHAVAPETVTVNVSLKIDSKTPAQTIPRVREALGQYFAAPKLGKSVLRAQLTSLAFGVDGVDNCLLVAPADDVSIGRAQLSALGTVTVEEME